MNRILWEEQLTPIEADYARWCDEQGALLRSGKLDAIDRENLAEEIESLGRSERREIESRLNILLLHLLKWKFQSEKRKSGWKGSILEARRQLRRILAESPSLKNYPAQILREEYEIARLKAADETGLGEDNFPQECPFTMDDIFDETFLPADI
ncbi:MAG TPA: DUF29 domain-containing protein [Rhizobiaceae bacterium]|nr:DUF29 domain-containing protein [Rhizobiaceae bacterium]